VFNSAVLGWPFAGFAVIGVILAAVYTLRWFRVGFMGEAQAAPSAALAPHERLALGALAVAVVAGGLFPNLLLGPISGSVDLVLASVARLAGF
jgi:NADH-quinone oxidoreductase subunit M